MSTLREADGGALGESLDSLVDLETLAAIEQRVLWLAVRIVGGLQAYPSRTKDAFPVDYSTGSVGLGSAAPLFGALADRFTESRLGTSTGDRFISLLGDAELDEGNIWEAVAEPLTRRLGTSSGSSISTGSPGANLVTLAIALSLPPAVQSFRRRFEAASQLSEEEGSRR